MKNIILFITGICLPIAGYFAFQATRVEAPVEALSGFSDPFVSLQLATSPTAGYILSTDGTNNSWIANTGGAGGGDSSLFTLDSANNQIYTDAASTTATTSLRTAFIVSTTTATSTFAGGINMGTNHLVAHGIQASESGGLHIHSNNGTEVAFFGVGGGSNSTFSGGVNIDGATRLATSLNGIAYLTNGAVTGVATNTLGLGTVTSVDMSVPTGLSISGNPITTSGTLALTYASGYAGVLTASTTNWNNFYDTPSTRISDGLGLTWSSNTLNCDTATGLNFGCLLAADWTTFNNKVSSTSIDTSAELAALVTDETGTDKLVFSASPTFTGTAGFADLTGTNATITSATTTNLAVTGLFNFLGDIITNVATWFSTTLNAVSAFVAAASSTWDFGGAASLEIPNGASPTVDATGETALDTTFGQLKYFDGGTTHVLTGTTTKGFNIASTTKDGTGGSFNTGTTTLLLINDAEPQTLIGWYCQATTTGSVSVRFGDGTNWTNDARCSTGGFTTAASNNTFTSFEGLFIQVGSQATNPSRVTVSPVFKKTEQ